MDLLNYSHNSIHIMDEEDDEWVEIIQSRYVFSYKGVRTFINLFFEAEYSNSVTSHNPYITLYLEVESNESNFLCMIYCFKCSPKLCEENILRWT